MTDHTAQPARPSPLTTRLLSANFVVLVITGVPLLWTYEPANGHVVQVVHTLASAVFVMTALVASASTTVARLRRRETGATLVSVLAVTVLALLGAALGAGIAWQTIAGEDFAVRDGVVLAPPPGPPVAPSVQPDVPQRNGIWSALSSDVEAVVASNGTLLTPGEYRTFAVGHIILVPLALLGIYYRQRQRSGSSAALGDSGNRDPSRLNMRSRRLTPRLVQVQRR